MYVQGFNFPSLFRASLAETTSGLPAHKCHCPTVKAIMTCLNTDAGIRISHYQQLTYLSYGQRWVRVYSSRNGQEHVFRLYWGTVKGPEAPSFKHSKCHWGRHDLSMMF